MYNKINPKITSRRKTGDIGEKIACGYLGGKGYEILETNFRTKFGEIDIITKSPLKTLTFIEVKTSITPYHYQETFYKSYPHISGTSGNEFVPEDNMSSSKLLKFRKISQWYANNHLKSPNENYQLDAICISLSPENKLISLKHFKNI
jgi:hypothetical protein